MSPLARLVLTANLALATGRVVVAQQPTGSPATAVVIAADPEYQAGGLHRLLFGSHWRDLWVTPLHVDVLDLGTFAGGLTPLKVGGGLQTKSLRFAGADGRQYAFRSINKDPSKTLPPALRETIAASLLQDQISAGHPAAALVVAPLLRAAGVLHAESRMVVMPDDHRLGEFRAEFAGVLGTIEERPTGGDEDAPGFAGAGQVVSSLKLLQRLEQSPDEALDARAYLAARLMDVFLGDWDRHQDQWRWAKLGQGDSARWYPIPRDRDMAFARLDGLLLAVARFTIPQVVGFGDRYPNMVGLTWTAQEMDRRLLSSLERPVWDSVAMALRGSLSDSVIMAAVRRLPPEYQSLNAGVLASALRRRRDRLPEAARSFYRLLAVEVDVHATDRSELTRIRRLDARTVEVALYNDTAGVGSPYFFRTLDAGDTHELRLFLHGGDDRLVVVGDAAAPITLRVIGGGGDDELVDSTRAGGVHFYDARGTARTRHGPGTTLDRRVYTPPPRTGTPPQPFRDWGHAWLPTPWLSLGSDLGLFLGAGLAYTRFGFRKEPYAYRVTARGGYATGAGALRGEVEWDRRRENSRTAFTVAARASETEVLHFYGLGNETAGGPSDSFVVNQQQYALGLSLSGEPVRGVRLSAGPVVKYAETDLTAATFIARALPYGTPTFGQVGLRGTLLVDRRDHPVAAERGVLFTLGGSLYPGVWDVARTFGEVQATAATYLTLAAALRPTLALRVGGKKVWGQFPFHEAAYLGGAETLRGWSEQRFAGDAAAYGNAELRVPVGTFFVLLPGRFGVSGLTDVGRVWVAGSSSDVWHASVGGGVWFAFLDRGGTLSAAVARGPERTGVYVRAGFLF